MVLDMIKIKHLLSYIFNVTFGVLVFVTLILISIFLARLLPFHAGVRLVFAFVFLFVLLALYVFTRFLFDKKNGAKKAIRALSRTLFFLFC